ncbi:unnamed protein product [Rhizoctonia solani]|uniref:Secreted protein n=1 Tax=Rhizoctonia solani TaxID=456999 RepID=A0A8H3BI73_9AGAM|nr:unnamed protein product [Rhizoctonia solani]
MMLLALPAIWAWVLHDLVALMLFTTPVSCLGPLNQLSKHYVLISTPTVATGVYVIAHSSASTPVKRTVRSLKVSEKFLRTTTAYTHEARASSTVYLEPSVLACHADCSLSYGLGRVSVWKSDCATREIGTSLIFTFTSTFAPNFDYP